MEEGTLIAVISILASAIVAFGSLVIGPYVQERLRMESEKKTNRLKKEEELYNILLKDIEAFYEASKGHEGIKEKRQEFVEAYRLLWLYATDEIIQG